MKPQHRARLLAATLWLALLAAGYAWGRHQGYTLVDMLRIAYDFMAGNPLAPVIYIAVFVLRTVVFVPAIWLVVLSGSLFGFWAGAVYTVIAENLSANLGYALGRMFGVDSAEGDGSGFIGRWRHTLQEQAFTTVLILRVIYMPFDVLNYGCGLLAVPWLPYALATFVGLVPSVVTFVSFGASINFGEFLRNIDHFSPSDLFDARQMAISAGLFVFSLVIAGIVHRQHRQRSASTSAP